MAARGAPLVRVYISHYLSWGLSATIFQAASKTTERFWLSRFSQIVRRGPAVTDADGAICLFSPHTVM
eukprot:scaffold38871_cov34-Attheya_sp.AAC.4